jgi:hypothetical protein
MIQQLRLQPASLTPPAKAPEEPPFGTEFTDLMGDDTDDPRDQSLAPDPGVALRLGLFPAPLQPDLGLKAPPAEPDRDAPGEATRLSAAPSAATAPPDSPLRALPAAPPEGTMESAPLPPPQTLAKGAPEPPAAGLPQPQEKTQPAMADVMLDAKTPDLPGRTRPQPGTPPKAKADARLSGQTGNDFASPDQASPPTAAASQDPLAEQQALAPSPDDSPAAAALQAVQQSASPPLPQSAGLAPARQPAAKPVSTRQIPNTASMPVTVQLSAVVASKAEAPLTPPPEMPGPRSQSLGLSQRRDPIIQDISASQPDAAQASAAALRQTEAAADQPRLPLTAPANLHSQLLQHAPAAIDRQVEVLLAPEELGCVKFQIRHHGDTVSILLSAERSDTMDMLRRHGDELMREFRQAGFNGATLDFGRWGQQQHAQQRAPASFSLPEEFTAPPPLPRPIPRSQSLSDAQGLNLRL